MALPNCHQRCSPERRTGAQLKMKMSPTLARKSRRPASRYFPRNFSTREMLNEQRVNFNDEARMIRVGLALNDEKSPNAQMIESAIGNFFIVNRGFVIPSSFVMRH